MPQAPDWRERIRADVAVTDLRPDGLITAKASPRLEDALAIAAQKRGIAKSSYVRRCVLAFIALDLDLDWPDAVDLDDRMAPLGMDMRNVAHIRDEGGYKYGSFRISGLAPAYKGRR